MNFHQCMILPFTLIGFFSVMIYSIMDILIAYTGKWERFANFFKTVKQSAFFFSSEHIAPYTIMYCMILLSLLYLTLFFLNKIKFQYITRIVNLILRLLIDSLFFPVSNFITSLLSSLFGIYLGVLIFNIMISFITHNFDIRIILDFFAIVLVFLCNFLLYNNTLEIRNDAIEN